MFWPGRMRGCRGSAFTRKHGTAGAAKEISATISGEEDRRINQKVAAMEAKAVRKALYGLRKGGAAVLPRSGEVGQASRSGKAKGGGPPVLNMAQRFLLSCGIV